MAKKASIALQSSSSLLTRGPSMETRYTVAALFVGLFSLWFHYTFSSWSASHTPGVHVPMHSYRTPLCLTSLYLLSLPALTFVAKSLIPKQYDVKALLTESMIVYNVLQVLLNGWMVYQFLRALLCNGHPFIGDILTTNTGTSFAIWVHYCDKYLEFFDTYFMILRGRFDQVSFLHVYHHFSIAWAWWAAMTLFPGGDSYFGALLNSYIHVMMYAYYALTLLKISCPWKKYLTQMQLLQFTSVVIYSIVSLFLWKEKRFQHVLCTVIQIWEMMSLFALFLLFYRKSYSGNNKKSPSSTPAAIRREEVSDQCQAAVRAAANAVESAAMDASKMATSAKKVLHDSTSPVQKEASKAMSRPSWSITS